MRYCGERWSQIQALKALEAFCATLQQGRYRHPVLGSYRSIDLRAREVIWLRTPPRGRVNFAEPGFTPSWKQLLVGPRSLKYPTRKAIRYVESPILESECDKVFGKGKLDYTLRKLKDQLDRQLKWPA